MPEYVLGAKRAMLKDTVISMTTFEAELLRGLSVDVIKALGLQRGMVIRFVTVRCVLVEDPEGSLAKIKSEEVLKSEILTLWHDAQGWRWLEEAQCPDAQSVRAMNA